MASIGDLGLFNVGWCFVVAVVSIVVGGAVIIGGLVKVFRCAVVVFVAVFLVFFGVGVCVIVVMFVIGVCVLVVIRCLAQRLLVVVSVVRHFGVLVFFGE